jgi:UDP-glucose 4-epimerase
MRTVGVFGANGFIGRHLTRLLVAKSCSVVCFARHFPLDFQQEFGRAVEMRLIDLQDDLGTCAKLQGITHVVQLINSSNGSLGNQKVVSDISSNLLPQVSFISSCVSSGVSSFTFVSSGGTVYGRPEFSPISEDHPTLPLNSYGLTKLATEQYLRMLCRGTGMGYNILRVANPYGPGQLGTSGQGLIGTILQKHLKNEAISIFGDGTSERDYVYIDDTVDAMCRSVMRDPINDVVNIGSGQGRSILEVIFAIENALGDSVRRVHIENRSTDAPSNVLDVTKAMNLLGWQATTPFDLGVAKTIEWNMAHDKL